MVAEGKQLAQTLLCVHSRSKSEGLESLKTRSPDIDLYIYFLDCGHTNCNWIFIE